MLILVFLMLWLVIAAAPETPIAGSCRRWLVEAPARRLLEVRRETVLIAAVLLGTLALASLLGDDARQIVAFGSPDVAIWMSSIEFGTCLDIVAGALLAAPVLRPGTAQRWLSGRVRLSHRHGRRAARPRRAEHRAANDDDPAPMWRRTA